MKSIDLEQHFEHRIKDAKFDLDVAKALDKYLDQHDKQNTEYWPLY